jgi:hypothetical protein
VACVVVGPPLDVLVPADLGELDVDPLVAFDFPEEHAAMRNTTMSASVIPAMSDRRGLRMPKCLPRPAIARKRSGD